MHPSVISALSSALAALTCVHTAVAQDVPTIRFGRQTAAEDNVWLMLAKPDLTPNAGKAYKVEWSQFRASDVAFKAYQAGQVDLVTTACNSVIAAASKGVDIKVIASVSRETQGGAKTQYLSKKDGGPASIQDLKGKIVGIVGHRTATELWARMALKTAGLDPDKDVSWAVVPFASVADAVRSDKIAVGAVPDLFAPTQLAKGDLKVLFTSKTGMPFDEELICVNAAPAFLAKHGAAVRGFLADLKSVTTFLIEKRDEARKVLLEAKLVQLPPDIYLASPEYARDPNLMIDLASFTKQQDALVSAGFVDSRVDLGKLVDLTFLTVK
jgi:ABC-type nitrate/sulfonate/bicarbonate transport system substrate-binding protein